MMPRVASAPAGEIRIIAGQWKRTPIAVVDAPGLRPTPNRLRETVFNWLGHRLDGLRVLDLFAGTGALGFEAASRGAQSVTLVETHRGALMGLEQLKRKLAATNITIMAKDAMQVLAAPVTSPFDLVFLDPPFGQGWHERIAPSLLPHLAPRARIVVEDDKQHDAWPKADLLKHTRAGKVHHHLFILQE
jgi:16S rRNA (guanine(966)-N(2))-methyltransferase RsmD